MKRNFIIIVFISIFLGVVFGFKSRVSGDRYETIELSIPSVSSSYDNIDNAGQMAQKRVDYVSFDVPNIQSFFKAWMDYRAVTNKQSPQYKFIHTNGWRDANGFMRCGADWDYGITDDYYLIALGSYYGTTIGTKYRITTDVGNVFYGVLADCKADSHTDSTNRYNPWNGNVVEFIVDSKILNKDVKRMGSANIYMPLNGNISSIERIDFITE